VTVYDACSKGRQGIEGAEHELVMIGAMMSNTDV
jgi:hypothetical protein